MIDFHSHILPGIDDGSKSLDESIAMLCMEAEQGIDHVVATPHFYPQYDTPEDFLRKRTKAEAVLRAEMQKHTGLPKLTVGAEVYYYHGISESDVLRKLTIGNSKYVMIEMPGVPWRDTMYRELEMLYRNHGIMPIMAHMDRYFTRFRTYGIPEKLERLPVLVQANASFFCGRSAARAVRMLQKEQIHLLGSDCHNIHTRQPNLGKAIEVIQMRLGTKALERIASFERDVLGG